MFWKNKSKIEIFTPEQMDANFHRQVGSLRPHFFYQVIPSFLSLFFIATFAFGVGFFLLRFNEKVTAEIVQSQEGYAAEIGTTRADLRPWDKTDSPEQAVSQREQKY